MAGLLYLKDLSSVSLFVHRDTCAFTLRPAAARRIEWPEIDDDRDDAVSKHKVYFFSECAGEGVRQSNDKIKLSLALLSFRGHAP